jgi:hypothetical protein
LAVSQLVYGGGVGVLLEVLHRGCSPVAQALAAMALQNLLCFGPLESQAAAAVDIVRPTLCVANQQSNNRRFKWDGCSGPSVPATFTMFRAVVRLSLRSLEAAGRERCLALHCWQGLRDVACGAGSEHLAG